MYGQEMNRSSIVTSRSIELELVVPSVSRDLATN